jgi:hypothetical protein
VSFVQLVGEEVCSKIIRLPDAIKSGIKLHPVKLVEPKIAILINF